MSSGNMTGNLHTLEHTDALLHGGLPANQLTLESSDRLSPGISLHTFSSSSGNYYTQSFHPSGQIDLLLLEDLDPTRPSTREADRQLTFTPATVRHSQDGHLKVFILARNGRTTQLLGLPRLQGPLKSEIVSSSGGFPKEVLHALDHAVCIASGTGLAPFLAIESTVYVTSGSSLYWTINGNDFGAVESLIVKTGLLKTEKWASVRIFVTSGDEVQGLTAGKPMHWWDEKFAHLKKVVEGDTLFKYGRMNQDDLSVANFTSDFKVLFCGNKSLEWQVKMWFLNKARVYTTSMV